jgi:hypothetical protein
VDTRRRIDLCTCGQPRYASVHAFNSGYANAHPFMPNPQPPPPALSLPDAAAFHRIHALRLNGVWVAEVYGAKMGRGQAVQWMDAVNAALEDLKEKTS